MYLGFTREESTGTTFLTFELNHDDRLWDNGKARIPCRRTGDVLISYEQLGNDCPCRDPALDDHGHGHSTAAARRRVCSRPSGSWKRTIDVQAAMNDRADPEPPAGRVHPARCRRGRFGEAALNLSAAAGGGVRRRVHGVQLGLDALAVVGLGVVADAGLRGAAGACTSETCTASGTKFFDFNANGRRDPDEPGIPRFQIWADYNDNGIREDNEPFSVSDSSGRYVIHDIRPPDGTYMLREKLLRRRSRALPVASDWQCSYPNASTPGGTGSAPNGRFQCGWGPFNVNTDPNVEGRDFGNWFPARLTVEKRLFPSADPGRFDLLRRRTDVFVPTAGDRAIRTESVAPGTYTVSERAVTGTDPAAYRTAVWCRGARLRGSLRSGALPPR